MEKGRFNLLKFLTILSLFMFLFWTLPAEGLARAGRGLSGDRSSGSRGLRSTTPVQPNKLNVQATTPNRSGLAKTTPSRRLNPSSSRSTDSFWRDLGSGFLGGWAGGMIVRWLFGGPEAGAGSESDGSYSFGLIDLILMGVLGGFIYWLVTWGRRRQAAPLQGSQQSNPAETSLPPANQEQEPSPPTEPEWDLETGLRYIEQSDPLFSETKFKDQAMDYFFKIQGAWVDRDLSTVKHLLTREMFDLLQKDADNMRRDGLINRLQNMAVREVNLTEAWQESGQDYLTVRIYVTLLDYTLNEKTGEIVSGSQVEPVKFEEYLTFTRPLGNNPWQLSAVTQAE